MGFHPIAPLIYVCDKSGWQDVTTARCEIRLHTDMVTEVVMKGGLTTTSSYMPKVVVQDTVRSINVQDIPAFRSRGSLQRPYLVNVLQPGR